MQGRPEVSGDPGQNATTSTGGGSLFCVCGGLVFGVEYAHTAWCTNTGIHAAVSGISSSPRRTPLFSALLGRLSTLPSQTELKLVIGGSTRRSCCMLRSEEKDRVDVVIIGAGVAGLAAGRYLLQSTKKKYNVTILEARNRIGGRVWTNLDAFPGAVGGEVDCGGSWIHGGGVGNPIRDLADKFNIQTVETDCDDIAMKRNGETMSSSEYHLRKAEYEKMMQDLDDADVSAFGDVSFRTGLEKLGYGEKLKDPVLGWFVSLLHDGKGASMDRVSVACDNYQTFEGNDRIFIAGYSQVPQCLQRGASDEQSLSVLHNQVVERVVHGDGSVTVLTQSSQFQADRVIVTLPLGVLKSGDVVFEPALSACKQEAIRKIGFGHLGKVILKFDSVFWDPKKPFFGYVSEEIGKSGFLTLWMNGHYFWGTSTLIGFVLGESAINAENMSDGAIRNEAMDVVRKLFGSGVPDPTGFFRTTWLSDPYARGTYSYLAVGSTASHRAALGQHEHRLHFAGEHTENNYFSTVHGAYLSGIRAAKEIDDSYVPCF